MKATANPTKNFPLFSLIFFIHSRFYYNKKNILLEEEKFTAQILNSVSAPLRKIGEKDAGAEGIEPPVCRFWRPVVCLLTDAPMMWI